MDLQDSVQRSLQNPAEKSCRSAQIHKDRKPGVSSGHSPDSFIARGNALFAYTEPPFKEPVKMLLCKTCSFFQEKPAKVQPYEIVTADHDIKHNIMYNNPQPRITT